VPNVPAALEALKRNPNVLVVEENSVGTPGFTPNDYEYGLQWYLKHTFLNLAWNITRGTSSNSIAILDTGVDYRHPDLASRVAGGWNFAENNNDYRDCNGHGTGVAGVAAAVTHNGAGVAGVDHFAKIYVAKLTIGCNAGIDSYVLAWAINSASTWPGVKVINISYCLSYSDWYLENAIKYARGRNVVVVACACNDSTNAPRYPAALPGVVGVAATDKFNKRYWTSNWGRPNVTVSAPGVEIRTTTPGDQYGSQWQTKYGYQWQTSFAAPQIAGMALLAWARHPYSTEGNIRWYLENAAWNPECNAWNCYTNNYGKGIVDAFWVVY
jgi:thermitase